MRLLASLWFVGLLCVWTASAAASASALDIELRALASDIARIVRKNGGGPVAVGAITGSADMDGHAGPGVQLALAKAFEAVELDVDTENYRFEVAARYQPFRDSPANRQRIHANPEEASGLYGVRLLATVIDRETGDPLVERPTGRLLFDAASVPAIMGQNVSHCVTDDLQKISDFLEGAGKTPQFEVAGARLAGMTGQYALEVLVKQGDEYTARSLTVDEGKPFVPLQTSEVYGVRLVNNTSHEAAVELTIDGVNSLAFSDFETRFWIISPNSHLDVLGWRRTATVASAFEVVGSFPETVASKLRLSPSDSIGLINASFRACWEDDADRPSDEPGGRGAQGRGTGFGEDIRFTTEQVTRTLGRRRDNLAIRYER